ncbi:MAG: urate hydroxylase PuuD [Chloroflexi bacterium]|nr:urate hydroxylase PuuD [Chloroflexota bacterium]
MYSAAAWETMSAGDVFLLVIRWIHLVAAAAWVGGSLFYLVVLRPALRKSPESGRIVNAAAASEFRVLVDTCIFVLLATGAILTLNRLTPGVVGVPYVATLGVKIALAVWMFVLARGRRRRTALLEMYREPATPASTWLQKALRAVSGYNTILILGIVVFLLSDLLKVLFELALGGN